MHLARYLPDDLDQALLIGRAWVPGAHAGPCVVVVRHGQVLDITPTVPTVADLLEHEDRIAMVRDAPGAIIDSVHALLHNSLNCAGCPKDGPILLAPCDLQVIKASGVTFAESLIERIIEERAGGDPQRAQTIRQELEAIIGADLASVRPGSQAAAQLKTELQRRNFWSQYLEVGIGPDVEVFSKAPLLSAVGFGAPVGLHPMSKWNNPEPEIVLAVTSRSEIVGATLGNDVNLRDVEGRSALLLSKAKDNNGSCAIGPFIRLFDAAQFTLDTVRHCAISLHIQGQDGFTLHGVSHMDRISRDPQDIVHQVIGAHHQYPDGFALFLGTMFAPTQDRGEPGSGFTHHLGDTVTISAAPLGALVNAVQLSTEISPWTFGVRALFRNLAQRGLSY